VAEPASRGPGRPTRTAGVLALGWVALIVYASLYPHAGWRWPPGASFSDIAGLPWLGRAPRFDVMANLFGYAPLGLLVCRAAAGRGLRGAAGFGVAVAGASGLSYAMEVAQYLLPTRVPSLLDWLLNTAGAMTGAAAYAVGHRVGVIAAWNRWHDHRLARAGDPLFLLLLCWPVALLAPTAMPFALGHVYPALHDALFDWFDGIPWAEPLALLLLEAPPATTPLSAGTTALVVGLGLAVPTLLAYAGIRPGPRRLWFAAGLVVLGLAATTASTTLNYGPEHALAWWTPAIGVALVAVGSLLVALTGVSASSAAAWALAASLAELMLVVLAPADPYFAQSLQRWNQGRFIHFNGAVQWIAWGWPFFAAAWLVGRLRHLGESPPAGN
jgi:VanZ family protein